MMMMNFWSGIVLFLVNYYVNSVSDCYTIFYVVCIRATIHEMAQMYTYTERGSTGSGVNWPPLFRRGSMSVVCPTFFRHKSSLLFYWHAIAIRIVFGCMTSYSWLFRVLVCYVFKYYRTILLIEESTFLRVVIT